MPPKPAQAPPAPAIRAALPAEADAVAALWVAFMREHNGQFLKKVRLTKANREAMALHFATLAVHGQVLVLEVAGAIAGFVAIVVDPFRLDLHYASATISDLYLAPVARGHGWGRALLDAAVALVRERGLHAVSLTVAAGNHAAEALYQSAGFVPLTRSYLLPLDPDYLQFGPGAAS